MKITGQIKELNVEPVTPPARVPEKENPIPHVIPAEHVTKPEPFKVPQPDRTLQPV